MKKMSVLLWLTAFVFLCCGCGVSGSRLDNAPYEPDTPVPAAHEGTFTSDHGKMIFSGDGEHIEIDFDKTLSELTGLPEELTESEYIFLSGDLPPHGSMPVRYDTAHEMQITAGEHTAVIEMGIAAEDGKTAQAGIGTVTSERIPMLFTENGVMFTIVFEKEGDAT